MKSTISNVDSRKKLIASLGNDKVNFEIFQWEELNGGASSKEAESLFFYKNSNIKLKEAKITLNNGSIMVESGALYYQKGEIEMTNNIGGIGGLGKKLVQSMVTKEDVFKPTYKGSGEIVLEPTFGHYALVELENESIVVDDGVFYACESTIEVGVERLKSISSIALGGEGMFQTKLSGTGIALLELSVPQEEIIEYHLDNETLKVDGNFSVLRSGKISFTVEKSAKSLLGSATSGEGLLNVYRGTGTVWVLPTKMIYDKLKFGDVGYVNATKKGSNSRV